MVNARGIEGRSRQQEHTGTHCPGIPSSSFIFLRTLWHMAVPLPFHSPCPSSVFLGAWGGSGGHPE